MEPRRNRKPQANLARTCLFLGCAALATLWSGARAQGESAYSLGSPDRHIHVSIRFPATGRPEWSATLDHTPVVNKGKLGLQTAKNGELLEGVRLIHETHRSVDQSVQVLFGKSNHANDRYNERTFQLETREHRRVDVIFRCYNDAVALRYELPGMNQIAPEVISDEKTSFGLPGNPVAYAQYLENYNTSHEHNVTNVSAADLPIGQLLDMPLTLCWPDGTCAAITEGALRHYAGMSLRRVQKSTDGVELVCQLTPLPDGNKVVSPLPLKTPWRVVLMANRIGALLESGTLYCLNEPSVIQDVSWIQPGKITFSWWNGDVYDGHRDLPILSFAMAKKYIDFCARSGIPTHSLTSDEKTVSPWYFQSNEGVAPGPDTDVTRLRADFDLPAIRQYAVSQHIRLWTWVHQGALRGRVEEAFSAFEKMGWSGMMVDFFDHDDQPSIEHAEAILQAAARHHILIHFHGIWKPTGWQRTYPNLMNHEGALNFEYLKWSDRCTPEHNILMAYTRLIAGPMDYHLGGFRAVPRSRFEPHNIAPNVLGTRCHQLGLYVCYDNPNPMVADYPTAYEGQPGFDFLQAVPTWWDETRIVAGKIGEVLVTARRKGSTWYLGAISAGAPHDLQLPLSFLRKGRYQARIWKDAVDSEQEPNHLETATRECSRSDSLPIHFSRDGGLVAEFSVENGR